MKRSTRLSVARETVEIIERGSYVCSGGERVDVGDLVSWCLDATRLFSPEEIVELGREVLSRPADDRVTTIDVHNETTLQGIRRLLSEGVTSIAALNFASARNPGGGFLNGSQAQEESLARSSALYASQLRAGAFYQRHRAERSCLYSDAMILSPNCPVIRDDDGNLLAQPMATTFITSAAPNLGAIRTNSPQELPLIPAAIDRRSECVLALAAAHGYQNLVLGAWGCGVFQNDPHVVARAFAKHLLGAWAGRFNRVVFSVLDGSKEAETIAPFRRAFRVSDDA